MKFRKQEGTTISHVIDYAPDAVESKVRHCGILAGACKMISTLELVLPPGAAVGPDGLIVDAKGKVLTKGAMHYRTWKDDHGGRLVGDWPVPAGMTAEDVGENAVAVVRLTAEARKKCGGSTAPYEVGVIPQVDPKTGEVTYSLCHDFFNKGYGLEAHVGETEVDYSTKKVKSAHGTLLQHYQLLCAKLAAEEAGHTFEWQKTEDGGYVAVADKQNVGISAGG